MTVALVVRSEQGEVLYNTSKSVYGLVKSGGVEYVGTWLRYASGFRDHIYKFTVRNGISPILFVVGDSGKPYQSKEGNDQVFYFAGPVSGIKVYCFDLMAPIFIGSALKTRDEEGKFTFNSLQRPLNIIGSSIAPPPSGPWSDKVPVAPFVGGSAYPAVNQTVVPGQSIAGWRAYVYRRALNPAVEYAAYIPWARGCFSCSVPPGTDATPYMSGAAEGCSGYLGGITHSFWAAPETSHKSVFSATPTGVYSLVSGPRPLCTYIDTSQYPFPFDPAL